MTWLNLQEAAALCGISTRHLRRLIAQCAESKAQSAPDAMPYALCAMQPRTRPGAKAANGRRELEILLESLPVEAQQIFYTSTGHEHEHGFDGSPESIPGDSAPDSTSGASSSQPQAASEPGTESASGSNLPPRGDGLGVDGPRPASPALSVSSLSSPSVPTPSACSNPSGVPTVPGAETRTALKHAVGVETRSLASLSEAELERLNNLAEILRSSQNDAAKAAALGMSIFSVQRKQRALNKYGLSALVRKPRADKGTPRKMDRKVVAQIRNAYLQNYRPPVSEIYRDIAKEYAMNGLRPPSYKRVLAVTRSIDPDLVARYRIGEKFYQDKFVYYTQRRRPPLPRQWCDADHHPCDHLVIFPDGSIGRPWLTAVQDICTNEILGFRLTKYKPVGKGSYPGASAISIALRHSIMRKPDPEWPSFGVFDNLYADLGRDFRSQYIRATCNDLNIRVRHARGYHGQSKPIERWFGVMELPLSKLPGYVGNSPENNPYRQRVGPPPSPEDLRKELMTVEQYEAALYDFIVKDFHHRESRPLKGLTPISTLEMHVKNGWTAREVRDERALDLLLMRRARKKVTRAGISIFGTQYEQRFFYADELKDFVNQEVDVFWDPAAIGELIIYKDARFLCKAQNRELLSYEADEEMLRSTRNIVKQQKTSAAERRREIMTQAQYSKPIERAAAEAQYEKLLSEERVRIAVNAEPQSVPLLLPQFAKAAKSLKGVSKAPAPKPSPADSWKVKEEPLASWDLFKVERNPWAKEDDE